MDCTGAVCRRITMEIERKWMVNGWPKELELVETYHMEQGYISVRPTVRIRREELEGGKTALVLCFKGAPGADGISREEIETEISEELFGKLEKLIGLPLIKKIRKTYLTKDGHRLEVNSVDEGLASAFWYAEIEYETEEEARSWQAAEAELGGYLEDECTCKKGSSMGEYWEQTRLL